jgi:hypothetical protein
MSAFDDSGGIDFNSFDAGSFAGGNDFASAFGDDTSSTIDLGGQQDFSAIGGDNSVTGGTFGSDFASSPVAAQSPSNGNQLPSASNPLANQTNASTAAGPNNFLGGILGAAGQVFNGALQTVATRNAIAASAATTKLFLVVGVAIVAIILVAKKR